MVVNLVMMIIVYNNSRYMIVYQIFQTRNVFVIWNHFHHHHHLFLKRPFLPRSARVRRFSRYEVSPHIPEHHPFRVQTQLIHIILHTFSPSLPAPTRTSHPCHHHISTSWHPIISTLTFHISVNDLWFWFEIIFREWFWFQTFEIILEIDFDFRFEIISWGIGPTLSNTSSMYCRGPLITMIE